MGSVAEILALVPNLGSSDRSIRQEAEQQMRAIDDRRRPTALVISTPDLLHFQGCWDLARSPEARDLTSLSAIGPR
jgi:hypothetical protein